MPISRNSPYRKSLYGINYTGTSSHENWISETQIKPIYVYFSIVMKVNFGKMCCSLSMCDLFLRAAFYVIKLSEYLSI